MRQRLRRVLTVPFIVAVAVWSILAYQFVFVFAGAHACSLPDPRSRVHAASPAGPTGAFC